MFKDATRVYDKYIYYVHRHISRSDYDPMGLDEVKRGGGGEQTEHLLGSRSCGVFGWGELCQDILDTRTYSRSSHNIQLKHTQDDPVFFFRALEGAIRGLSN